MRRRQKTHQTSLKRNIVMNALLALSSVLFPVITFPYVSRVLLPEGVGRVSFVTSVISYFLMLAQLGIPTYGIRACAKVRDDRNALTKTAQEILLIQIGMSIVSYLLLAAALGTVPRLQRERTLVLVVSASIFFQSIGMEWLYKALEQYTYITLRSLGCKLIACLALFALVRQESDVIVYGGISIFASSASNAMNFFHARRLIFQKPSGPYCIRRHLRAVLVFFAMSCATTVYTHLDVAMLGFLKTDLDVGYYHAAVKIKTLLVSLVTSAGAVLLPRASYYMEQGMQEAFERMTKKAIHVVVLVSAPLALYFMIFAEESIYFLSGYAYQGAIFPMQILMPTLLLIGLTNVMGIQILVPLGREKIVLYSEIAGAIVDFLCNMLFIPRMGSAGAAIGTLLAEAVVFAVQYGFLRRPLKESYRSIPFLLLLAGLAVGSAASVWVKWLDPGAFFALAVSSLLFFGGYGAILTAGKEPVVLEIREQIRSALRRIGKRAGKKSEGDFPDKRKNM